jgi:hypothetical protein
MNKWIKRLYSFAKGKVNGLEPIEILVMKINLWFFFFIATLFAFILWTNHDFNKSENDSIETIYYQRYEEGKSVGRMASITYFANYINNTYGDTAYVKLETILELEKQVEEKIKANEK